MRRAARRRARGAAHPGTGPSGTPFSRRGSPSPARAASIERQRRVAVSGRTSAGADPERIFVATPRRKPGCNTPDPSIDLLAAASRTTARHMAKAMFDVSTTRGRIERLEIVTAGFAGFAAGASLQRPTVSSAARPRLQATWVGLSWRVRVPVAVPGDCVCPRHPQ